MIAAGNPAKAICSIDGYLNRYKKHMEEISVYGEDYTLRGNLTEEKKVQKIQELENRIGYVD